VNWVIRNQFMILSFIFVIIYPTNSFAELIQNESERISQVEEDHQSRVNSIRELQYSGVSGIWFPRRSALSLLADSRELRIQRRFVLLQGEELQLIRIQMNRLREIADMERNMFESANALAESAERRALEAETSRDAWWRHPALWVAVGVVITILLEVAAVAVFAYIDPG